MEVVKIDFRNPQLLKMILHHQSDGVGVLNITHRLIIVGNKLEIF